MSSHARLLSLFSVVAAGLFSASTSRADDVTPGPGVNQDHHRLSLEAGAFTALNETGGPLVTLGYQFRPTLDGPDLVLRVRYLHAFGPAEDGSVGISGATVGMRPFLSLGRDDRWELGLGLDVGAYRGRDWYAAFSARPDLRIPLATHTALSVTPEFTFLWHPGNDDSYDDESYGGIVLAGSVGVVQSF